MRDSSSSAVQSIAQRSALGASGEASVPVSRAHRRQSPAPSPQPPPKTIPHLNLMPGSGLKRLFIELRASTRTRTGTAERKEAERGSGGEPRFHTTKISPAGGGEGRRRSRRRVEQQAGRHQRRRCQWRLGGARGERQPGGPPQDAPLYTTSLTDRGALRVVPYIPPQ